MGTMVDAWEAHADDWTVWARRPGHDSYWRFHRDAFLALLPEPGELTLDLGCGEGRVARDLARLGHRVVAMDMAPTMARRTAEADGDLEGVLCADACHLPFPDAAADLVVAFMALHDIDDMAAAVHESARVLRPGGRLCFAIVHPVNGAGTFQGGEAGAEFVIGDYFHRRRYGFVQEKDDLRMPFECLHRPLEDYFLALEAAGLRTEALREVRTGSGERWDRIPLFLDVRAARA